MTSLDEVSVSFCGNVEHVPFRIAEDSYADLCGRIKDRFRLKAPFSVYDAKGAQVRKDQDLQTAIAMDVSHRGDTLLRVEADLTALFDLERSHGDVVTSQWTLVREHITRLRKDLHDSTFAAAATLHKVTTLEDQLMQERGIREAAGAKLDSQLATLSRRFEEQSSRDRRDGQSELSSAIANLEKTLTASIQSVRTELLKNAEITQGKALAEVEGVRVLAKEALEGIQEQAKALTSESGSRKALESSLLAKFQTIEDQIAKEQKIRQDSDARSEAFYADVGVRVAEEQALREVAVDQLRTLIEEHQVKTESTFAERKEEAQQADSKGADLATDIKSEAAAREQAIRLLGDQISALKMELRQDIADEARLRQGNEDDAETARASLLQQIRDEGTERQKSEEKAAARAAAGETALAKEVADRERQIKERIAAHEELSAAVTNEEKARKDGDEGLSQRLDALQGDLKNETTERKQAVEGLKSDDSRLQDAVQLEEKLRKEQCDEQRTWMSALVERAILDERSARQESDLVVARESKDDLNRGLAEVQKSLKEAFEKIESSSADLEKKLAMGRGKDQQEVESRVSDLFDAIGKSSSGTTQEINGLNVKLEDLDSRISSESRNQTTERSRLEDIVQRLSKEMAAVRTHLPILFAPAAAFG